MESHLPWRVAGSYFESCNCDAICPCRMVGGVPGGRSTHGYCLGLLSWLIEEGHVGETDLSGFAAVLVFRYDDDVPGSPWVLKLHVDERGDDVQRRAVADVFLGHLGGERILALPWVRKPSEVLEVEPSRIELTHRSGGYDVRVGSVAALRAARAVETDERVSCIVPGHDRAGTELYADELTVHDDPFEWELSGNCAFASRFDYRSG